MSRSAWIGGLNPPGLIVERRSVVDGVVEISGRVNGTAGLCPDFRSKTALLTAVAEQAMDRLTEAVAKAQSEVESADPVVAFEAIGQGYLEWVIANPTHFQIISSRTLIDFDASESLRAQNEAIRWKMVDLLTEAQRQGRLAADVNLDHLALAARALVYSLARMVIDGHFPEWHPSEPPFLAVKNTLQLFMSQMTLPPKYE